MRTLFTLLAVLGAAVWAQPVSRTQIDMMPGIEQDQRAKLYRAFYSYKGRIDRANRRVAQINGALRKRPKPDQAKKWRAERGQLQKQLGTWHRAMLDGFKKAGLDAKQIQRMRTIPTGALREERYNHGVVLEVPDLTPKQRNLLTRLVAGVDAAQRALHVQHRHLQGTLKEADPLIMRQFNNAFYSGKSQMERRFWRIAYYILTADQMVAARKLFSPRYRYIPQLEQQMYMLPGMTPSQATRVRARFREHESEVAADQAALRRLYVRLRDKKLKKPERDELNKQVQACRRRMGVLNKDFRDALQALLAEPQLHALRARAPLLNVGEYNQGLRRAIGEMKPDRAQSLAIAAVRRDIQKQQREARNRMRNAMGAMRGADLGPDSPQQMTMQMMQRNAGAESHRFVRAGGHRVVLEVLRPGQVTDWVVAPVMRP